VAFYIEVDSTLKPWKTPVIGELYKDKNGEYSNHELSLVTTADENGWVKWYYVAPRIEQGAYNFEYQEPSGASSGFPSYTRSYVIKRSDVGDYFDECSLSHPAGSDYLAAGSADPDIAYNPEFCDFIYTSQKVVRVQDKDLDSLYVILERRFEKLCIKTSSRLNPRTGDVDDVVEEVVPAGDAGASAINTTTGLFTEAQAINCNFSKEVTSTDPTASMKDIDLTGNKYNPATCAVEAYTETVVLAGSQGSKPTDSTGAYTDVVPLNKLFSKEVTKYDPDWGLLDVPLTRKVFDKGTVTVKELTQTIVDDGGTAVAPVVDNDTSDGVYTEVIPISKCLDKEVQNVDPNWSLLQVKIVSMIYNDKLCDYIELESYIAETTSEITVLKEIKPSALGTNDGGYTDILPYYYDVTPINAQLSRVTKKVDTNWAMLGIKLDGAQYNQVDGNTYGSSSTIIKMGDVPQPDSETGIVNTVDPQTGMVDEYQPINSCLARKMTRRVRPDMDIVYYSTMNYTLPAVLGGWGFYNWPKRDGNLVTTTYPIFASEQETRMFPIRITRSWTEEAPAEDDVQGSTLIQPTRLQFTVPPFGVTWSAQATLHSAGNFSGTTGTENPVWEWITWNQEYDATTPEWIPEEIVISDVVTPSAGGYLRQTIELITGHDGNKPVVTIPTQETP